MQQLALADCDVSYCCSAVMLICVSSMQCFISAQDPLGSAALICGVCCTTVACGLSRVVQRAKPQARVHLLVVHTRSCFRVGCIAHLRLQVCHLVTLAV
jgi:hypothetical protein